MVSHELRSLRIHVEMVVEGHPRILHKACAKAIKTGNRDSFTCKAEVLDEMGWDAVNEEE